MKHLVIAALLLVSSVCATTADTPESFRDVKIPKPLATGKYLYVATVIRVVDGDTLDLKLAFTVPVDKETGFGITVESVNASLTDRVRLYGINAWETHETKVKGEKKKGLDAKAWLTKMVQGKTLYCLTLKDSKEKYGRLLAILLLPDQGGFSVVNQLLVDEGYAKYADY